MMVGDMRVNGVVQGTLTCRTILARRPRCGIPVYFSGGSGRFSDSSGNWAVRRLSGLAADGFDRFAKDLPAVPSCIGASRRPVGHGQCEQDNDEGEHGDPDWRNRRFALP